MDEQAHIDEKGYYRYNDTNKLVHRVKAYHKIYKINRANYTHKMSYYVVHHRDGNKTNNSLSNLMLMTQEEHNRIHGLNNKDTSQEPGILFKIFAILFSLNVLFWGLCLITVGVLGPLLIKGEYLSGIIMSIVGLLILFGGYKLLKLILGPEVFKKYLNIKSKIISPLIWFLTFTFGIFIGTILWDYINYQGSLHLYLILKILFIGLIIEIISKIMQRIVYHKKFYFNTNFVFWIIVQSIFYGIYCGIIYLIFGILGNSFVGNGFYLILYRLVFTIPSGIIITLLVHLTWWLKIEENFFKLISYKPKNINSILEGLKPIKKYLVCGLIVIILLLGIIILVKSDIVSPDSVTHCNNTNDPNPDVWCQERCGCGERIPSNGWAFQVNYTCLCNDYLYYQE